MKKITGKTGVLLSLVLVAGVAAAGMAIRNAATETERSGQGNLEDTASKVKELGYSKFYHEDGSLNWLDGSAEDYVTLCSYEGIELLYSDMNLAEDADADTINEKLNRYLNDYIVDCSDFQNLSQDFITNQTDIMDYELNQTYEFEKSVAELSYGTTYENIHDYYGMTQGEYEGFKDEQGNRAAALAVAVEAIAEKEQVQVNSEEVKEYVLEQDYEEKDYNVVVEEYGIGYLTHIALQDKVFDLIKEDIRLTKDGD